MQFIYKALNTTGEEIIGEIEAKDDQEAKRKVKASGNYLTQLLPSNQKKEKTLTPVVVIIPKSRSTAILFAILLGGLGIHKFYLNSPGLGIIYILFCWTFIPAIIGLIEGICYLSMSEQEFQQKYGNTGNAMVTS